MREVGLSNKCRFYQASSSEMFGMVQEVPQTEKLHFIHVLLTVVQRSMPTG